MYESENGGHYPNQDGGDEYDDHGRSQKGPVTLKNGATYTGQWL